MNTGDPELLAEAEFRVLRMQKKLHRWAVADPGRRFDDLANLVYDPAFLLVAWARVRGNKGARTAGIDGIAPRSVGLGAEELLRRLREELKANRFAPQRVREKAIPKASGKIRRLALTIEKHRARHEKQAQAAEKRIEREARERADRETRDRTLAERKRDVARVVENNTRQIEAAREQGKVFPSQELHDAHRDVVRTMRKVRRAEKSQTREMLRGIEVTGQDAKTMQRTLAKGRERNRADLNRGIDAIGAAVAVSAEVEAREKKERELQQVLERKHQEKQARTVAELDRAVHRGEMSARERAGYQAVLNSRSWDVTTAEQRRYDRVHEEQGRIKAREAPAVERGPREL